MTNEKRYELVCAMMRDFAASNGNELPREITKNPYKYLRCGLSFYEYAAELLIEAKQGMDKAVTPAGRLSALNRIFKGMDNYRPNLYGMFKSGDLWAICDGYRFIRTTDKPESIPECMGGLDLDKLIPQCSKGGEVVSLPSISEIKAAIADLKARYGREWKSNPIEPISGWWCNAQYLLDMVQALPDGTAYRPESPHKPLYYRSEDGDAVLLPVRHSA